MSGSCFKLTILLFSVLGIVPVNGQSLSDTVIRIREVVVRAQRVERQYLSARETKIETETIERNQTHSLGELLSENSVVHIKSLGRGALSTASFRGTSSNHTQISWNGIPINSPMSGGFDFSQVPVFFTDGVNLHHGSGAFRYGSGALGGNVNFVNTPSDTTRLSLLGEYGSDNTFAGGIALRKGFGSFRLASRFYYGSSDNNFLYLNKVLTKEPFLERRKNADYRQMGAMQELYWQIRPEHRLAVLFWWQQDNRNLPPPILVNASGLEHQLTQDFRTTVRYEYKKSATEWSISTAALFGTIDYSRRFDIGLGDLSTHSSTDSWTASSEVSHRFSSAFLLGGAANYRFDRVNSTAYTNAHDRHTGNARLFVQCRPLHQLLLEGQGMVETIGAAPAATYNVGATFSLPLQGLEFKVSNAYNHRFPTLNDLYWNPGGNPDLKAEQGISADATIVFSPTLSRCELKAEVSYFYMNIENWIMWIPTGNGYIWEPANFNRVISQGAEVRASIGRKVIKTHHKLLFNYAFTHSTNQSHRPDGTNGKQLPYIPRNKWNLVYSFGWQRLEANYTVAFTDIRFTSADQSYYTNAYLIHHASCSYAIPIRKCSLKATFRVENLFNAYYESTQYYPMPLRNFNLGIQLRW